MAATSIEHKAAFVQGIREGLHRLYNTATAASMLIADIKPRLDYLNEYTEDLPEDSREDHTRNIVDSSDALAEIQKLMDQILGIVKAERLRAKEYIEEGLQ